MVHSQLHSSTLSLGAFNNVAVQRGPQEYKPPSDNTDLLLMDSHSVQQDLASIKTRKGVTRVEIGRLQATQQDFTLEACLLKMGTLFCKHLAGTIDLVKQTQRARTLTLGNWLIRIFNSKAGRQMVAQ
jgi:hypothetical protein